MSDMSDSFYQPPQGVAGQDIFSILAILAPLFAQTGSGSQGMKDANSLIGMLTGGSNIADVLGFGPRAETLVSPAREMGENRMRFAGIPWGEKVLADIEGGRNPSEIVSELKEFANESDDVKNQIINLVGQDPITMNGPNWDRMKKFVQETAIEEDQLNRDFEKRAKEFAAEQSSRPVYGYEQTYGFDPEQRVRQAVSQFDPRLWAAENLSKFARDPEPDLSGGVEGIVGGAVRRAAEPSRKEQFQDIFAQQYEDAFRRGQQRALEGRKPELRPTADTQRVLDLLPLLQGLRGAFS